MNVFKPRKNAEDKSEFSAVLLIPKVANEFFKGNPSDEAKGIYEQIKEVAGMKFGSATKFTNPIKDGDKELGQEGEPKNPGYWYINAKCPADWPPALIDGEKNEVRSGWNSGDWGLVKVRFYAYDFRGKKGVGVGLKAIQFLYKDEPFGSSGSATDGFDTVAGAHKPEEEAYDQEYDPFGDQ
jgi:hypothetical protein